MQQDPSKLDLSLLNEKDWVVTRCGKVVLIGEHSVSEFSWEFADLDNPFVASRCNRFGIEQDTFNVSHPDMANVNDAIATQIPYFYWRDPGNARFSVIDVVENESNLVFLKSSDIDMLVGEDNWSPVAPKHDAIISFSKRLEFYQSQSDNVRENLYFLAEDKGWLILYRMRANSCGTSIAVDGMVFHNDPKLKGSSQVYWKLFGNKTLYLAFSQKRDTSKLQDSIRLNSGWSRSIRCLSPPVKIYDQAVNDNRFKNKK